MSLKKFLPVLAAVITVAALGSGGAAAANPIIDPCTTVPADRTLWLGEDIPKVEASSDGLAYTWETRPCKRFVVDVQVPSNASGGPGFTPAFSISALAPPLNPEYCKYFWQRTSVYRRTSSPGFKYLGSVGLYADGSCQLSPIWGEYDPWPSSFTPQKARVTTYRIAATMRLDSGSDWVPDQILPPLVRAAHFPVL